MQFIKNINFINKANPDYVLVLSGDHIYTMDYAKMIDHTLLKTDAQKKDLDKLLLEAKKYNFMSVCVSPIWVKYAAEQLKDTNVKVCTVIGFPQGATPTEVKSI